MLRRENKNPMALAMGSVKSLTRYVFNRKSLMPKNSDTSMDARRGLEAAGEIQKQQNFTLIALYKSGETTSFDLGMRVAPGDYGIRHMIARRLPEMIKKGLVACDETIKVKSKSGRSGMPWWVTEKGKRQADTFIKLCKSRHAKTISCLGQEIRL